MGLLNVSGAEFVNLAVSTAAGEEAFSYQGIFICDPTTGEPVAPSAFGGGGGGGGSTYPTIADSLVVDTVGAYFYAVLTEPSGGGTPTITYVSLTTGAIATPTGTVKPVEVANIVLAAGTNIIGKVGIDQTTPGTTNGVVVNSSALPTGAATSALQTTGNTSLSTLAGIVTGGVAAVSATALPLPTGAATSALQTTGNTSLSTLAGAVSGGNVQAVITAALPAGANIIGKVDIDQTTPGTTNGVVVNSSALPTGAATSALQTTGNTSLSTLAGIVTGGVAAVSATALPLPTGAATSALQTTGNTSLSAIATSVAAATPAGTNIIGKVGIDQTTPGTTNGVQINAALPAGTNAIGKVTSTFTDVAPAAVNITAQDTSSTNTTSFDNQVLVTGSPTANSAAAFVLASQGTVKVQITGTWTGTLQCETSIDSGTTWTPTYLDLNGSTFSPSTVTGNCVGSLSSSGCTNVRVRATAAWTGTAAVLITESLNVNVVNIGSPTSVFNSSRTVTDKSGTVTLGGAAQSPFAANPLRKGWMLSNLSNDILYVRDDGTAATNQTGVPVYPGQTISDSGNCTTTAISILGATTADAFAAKEYT